MASARRLIGILRKWLWLLRSDWRHNRRRARAASFILVVRDLDRLFDYQEFYLRWLRENLPEAASRIRLARLGPVSPRVGRAALVVAWLPDSLRDRFPVRYRWSCRLEARCAARSIPIVNPASVTSDGVKSISLPVIAATGIRTARVVPLRTPEARATLLDRLSPPLFIREDLTHGGGPHDLIEHPGQLREVAWHRYQCPVAVELIDVRSPDGYYRKYRYVLIGERGFPRHLIISRNWFVHAGERIGGQAAIDEEVAYLEGPDPNHERLDRARRALGLDLVAFDYSYERDGSLVVWEPNPTPTLWWRGNEEREDPYDRPYVERIYEALTRYLFERAGMMEIEMPSPRKQEWSRRRTAAPGS
ncbi:MAG TPA: hypothetical protein VM534_06905 [Thermoanaerobaculia bacterium]|nr:hypothetical protein [Thermoanaerobaculia bacterium]